jgi:hypothetical protein
MRRQTPKTQTAVKLLSCLPIHIHDEWPLVVDMVSVAPALLLAQLYAAWWSFFGFGLMLDFEKEAVFLII